LSRGTFDRGDLKEAASAAGRAIEPVACSLSCDAAQESIRIRTVGRGKPPLRSLRRSGPRVMFGRTEWGRSGTLHSM